VARKAGINWCGLAAGIPGNVVFGREINASTSRKGKNQPFGKAREAINNASSYEIGVFISRGGLRNEGKKGGEREEGSLGAILVKTRCICDEIPESGNHMD